MEVYFGWVGVAGHFLWVSGGWWEFLMGGLGCMGVSGGIFLVDWSGLTFFMGRRGWVEVYFGCVAVSGVGGGDHLF